MIDKEFIPQIRKGDEIYCKKLPYTDDGTAVIALKDSFLNIYKIYN